MNESRRHYVVYIRRLSVYDFTLRIVCDIFHKIFKMLTIYKAHCLMK